MSVWDSIVGQERAVRMLSAVVAGDPSGIAQSWLICGPPGSGRSNIARAFAAALESPDGGLSSEPTRQTQQVLAGTHPDVTVLATNKVTIGIDDVRDLIGLSEQNPSTAPWRIIIIEDVDRMLERTTNVLLKEIEEPAERTIWLLCAPSAQDVLPTIRSRTRLVNLTVPALSHVAAFLRSQDVDADLAARCARLSEGHIGVASLYARDDMARHGRDELVVGVLGLRRASDAVVLASRLVSEASRQAEHEVERLIAAEESEFRRINGLAEGDRIPASIRSSFNAIGKKDEVRRRITRLSRDVLDRALTSIASVYRDVAVLQNSAQDDAGLVNLENRDAIIGMSVEMDRSEAIEASEEIERARGRLAGNGNPTLVFEALFCSFAMLRRSGGR
ncbi:DNA polymerase III subunit delta' [uncultured Bifidobacterium sp.]|uniref:DNA polymerase III subunit delta' n=1 Tax=uncultured Bifidobacterium sp. TaxID=165187 RepID=UPI002619C7AD|nr:DNA polymerase III subunit delta' [uncultured Bifidobacterium sp.]